MVTAGAIGIVTVGVLILTLLWQLRAHRQSGPVVKATLSLAPADIDDEWARPIAEIIVVNTGRGDVSISPPAVFGAEGFGYEDAPDGWTDDEPESIRLAGHSHRGFVRDLSGIIDDMDKLGLESCPICAVCPLETGRSVTSNVVLMSKLVRTTVDDHEVKRALPRRLRLAAWWHRMMPPFLGGSRRGAKPKR